MLSIKNNLMAANAARHLGTSYGSLATSVERLSSGLRINSAKDDAAGLAVRELIRGDVAQLNQAARNAQDAVSLMQTAEGAMAVIDDLLVRMKELAEQAATGSYSADQIAIMNNEYTQLGEEITRIATSTTFNGISLLDNTNDVSFHLGSGTLSFTAENVTAGATGLQVDAAANSTSTATHGSSYAATVDSLYIQAADIDATHKVIDINMATDSDVTIDLSNVGGTDYSATGITLSQLVTALNDAAIAGDWTASDTAFAKATYDSTYGAYRLELTALTAGAGNDITIGSGANDVTAFDADADFAITNGAADGGSVSLVTDAAGALTSVSNAIIAKDAYRAKLGYYMNRLEAANTILNIQSENLQAAESRISDVDVATEMANMTRNQVLAQAGISMLAQANSMPQMALKLLG